MAEAVLGLRRVRLRTGAEKRGARGADQGYPNRVLEQFVVATWEEHERQHARMTERDRARVNAVRALAKTAGSSKHARSGRVTVAGTGRAASGAAHRPNV